jgi:hypothetical protein
MDYFFAIDGAQRGPFPKQDLIRNGMRPDSLAWREGLANWQRVDTLPELADLFQVAAAPAPTGFSPQQPVGYSAPPQSQQFASQQGQWSSPPVMSYHTPGHLAGGASMQHQLTEFSVAAVVLLHIFTLGIFSFFYWNLMHGKLPKNRPNDPSAGKAIGFCFIPFFNIYWIFFTYLRLVDRIDEQRQMRGLAPNGKGLIITGLISIFIPYIGFFLGLVIWPIAWGSLQASVNEIVRVDAGRAGQIPAYR